MILSQKLVTSIVTRKLVTRIMCLFVSLYCRTHTQGCPYMEANDNFKSWVSGCYIQKVDLPCKVLTSVIFLSCVCSENVLD